MRIGQCPLPPLQLSQGGGGLPNHHATRMLINLCLQYRPPVEGVINPGINPGRRDVPPTPPSRADATSAGWFLGSKLPQMMIQMLVHQVRPLLPILTIGTAEAAPFPLLVMVSFGSGERRADSSPSQRALRVRNDNSYRKLLGAGLRAASRNARPTLAAWT